MTIYYASVTIDFHGQSSQCSPDVWRVIVDAIDRASKLAKDGEASEFPVNVSGKTEQGGKWSCSVTASPF